MADCHCYEYPLMKVMVCHSMSNSHKVMTALIVLLWLNCFSGKFLTNFIDNWILVIGMAWFCIIFATWHASLAIDRNLGKNCVTFVPKMPMFEGPIFRGR